MLRSIRVVCESCGQHDWVDPGRPTDCPACGERLPDASHPTFGGRGDS